MDSLASSLVYGFGTVFALGLFLVSLKSYQKAKNKKILFVCCVLFVFFIKFILLSISIFSSDLQNILSIATLGVFDFLMLVLLFTAVLTKS